MALRKRSLLAWSVASALTFSHCLLAAPEVAPVDWLLRQIRAGEATNKYELVAQALYRLEKIDPDNPQVLAAKVRLALHQGDQAKAQQWLSALQKAAPDALYTREAAADVMLMTAEGRQKLQQARLLATAGRLQDAREQYQRLFNGHFPTVETALEYWRLVARLPDGEREAQLALQKLDERYPGSIGVRMALAQLALTNNQQTQAVSQWQRVAADPAGRQQAAESWLASITSRPVSPQTLAELKQYLQTFNSGDAQSNGQKALQRQQTLLADPAYQQRLRGLQLIERGAGAQAIPSLQAALQAAPEDGELLGAMGQALSRSNQRAAAIGYYQRALKADAESYRLDKWRSLLSSDRYWLAIEQGDKALASKQVSRAQQYYQQARRLDSRDAWALIGLGDVALAQGDKPGAERFWQQALRLDANNGTAAGRLVNVYQQQSPQKAMAYIQTRSPAQQRAMGETFKRLRSDVLRSEAEAVAAKGQWAQAAVLYQRAQQDAPEDIWLNVRLAEALRASGQVAQADRAMTAMQQRHPQDPAQVYAYGLWLSGTDRTEQAITAINQLPQAQWDSSLRDLSARLQTEVLISRASQRREEGDEPAAEALIRQQPLTNQTQLLLADWALARGDARQALEGYRAVKPQSAESGDAQLGEIEALIALKRDAEARQLLVALPESVSRASLNAGRRVANAWQSVGETQRAQRRFAELKTQARPPETAQNRALVWRDAARLAREQQQPQQALADYRQAMAASGISQQVPQQDAAFSRLTRNQASDDWLKRGIRSEAADLYRQQDTRITLEQDASRNKGTGGYSDVTGHTTMLQIDTPVAAGNGFLRADHVYLDAGRFTPDAEGRYSANYGTCALVSCASDYQQKSTGVSLGAGWSNARWSADVGTTPLGFDVVDWVGGLTWNTDIQDVGLSLTASRRPISSSRLAFAGATDPNTGITWGGVRATGGALGLSYDTGGAHGVWADVSAHQLTGKNVADNSRERLMAGYYYKVINEDNRRATVGLNSMVWHYAKDLSDYYLSQGGYYSPQRYFSLAVPVSYRQRLDNWSFEVGGSVSWSRSHTDGGRDYPRSDWVPGNVLAQLQQRGVDNDLANRGEVVNFIDGLTHTGGTSSGFGYTVRAIVERRVTAHWTLGLGLDIQQAKDYTPSHGLVYVRYAIAVWDGDLDLPPQPLTPYADFK